MGGQFKLAKGGHFYWYFQFIPANTKLFQTLDSFNTNNNNQILQLSYHGISFEYPNNWRVEKEELQEDLAFIVTCEKKGINSSEIFTITWLNMEMEPQEMIHNSIEEMKEIPVYNNLISKPIYPTIYKNYHAYKSDFDITLFGENYYGRIISFNSNGKTILVVKQTDNINKLGSEFKIIESSLNIE